MKRATSVKLWWHAYYGWMSSVNGFALVIYGESSKPPEEVAEELPTDRDGQLHYIMSWDSDPGDEAETYVLQTIYEKWRELEARS